MNIPYTIFKGKEQLGVIVQKKTTIPMCLTSVKNEDNMELNKIVEVLNANFNNKFDVYQWQWGGGIMRTKKPWSRVKSPLIYLRA